MLKSPFRWLPLFALLASAHAAHAPKTASAKALPHAEVVGFWRFERDVKPEPRGNVGPAKRVDGAEFFFADEVPGPYIYDPLQKLSYPNSTSLNFQSSDGHNDALEVALNTAKAGLPGQSVTLELFFKPEAEFNGPLAAKARLNDAAAEWGLEARYFEQQRQTYLHAFFTPPGGETVHFRGGHYGSSVQVRADYTAWRHMAFVYDAPAKTLTSYVDYYQAKTVPLPGEMKWDEGSFYIGGGATGSRFGGLIDEVRLSKGALRPAQFLRARKDPIAGISFESAETVLPRDSGYVDLKEAFGAVGDGKVDDTAALQEAFRVLSNQAPVAHNTLYIPPGTYLVSDTLQSGHSLDIQGAGSEKTMIKLRDKCAGFVRASEPRAIWQVDNAAAPPVPNGPAGENLTGISIYGLSINTGKGNAGAKGIEIQGNRVQCIEDLQIHSGDGAGLAFTPQASTTAVMKNVRIAGFRNQAATAAPPVEKAPAARKASPSGPSSPSSPATPPTGNTPAVPWGDIHKDWVNVQKYEDKKAGDDWAPAIQAALDSGACTVYFPPGRYEVLGAVHVHGKVDRLFGLCSHIARGNGFTAEDPVVIFDQPDAKHTLSLERLDIDGLRHTSAAALVLKCTNAGRYEKMENCGKLLLENGSSVDSHQTDPQPVP